MKPRRVMIMVEATTDLNQAGIRKEIKWVFEQWCDGTVHQVQVNVIKPEPRVRGRIVPVDQGDRVVRQ